MTTPGQWGRFARGRSRGGKQTENRLERAYRLHLEARLHAGEITWMRPQGVKLRLADNTFFTPDFAVMLPDGEMQLHETKGFMQDDAGVKLKVAAEMYPFHFFLVRARTKRDGGGWDVRSITDLGARRAIRTQEPVPALWEA